MAPTPINELALEKPQLCVPAFPAVELNRFFSASLVLLCSSQAKKAQQALTNVLHQPDTPMSPYEMAAAREELVRFSPPDRLAQGAFDRSVPELVGALESTVTDTIGIMRNNFMCLSASLNMERAVGRLHPAIQRAFQVTPQHEFKGEGAQSESTLINF
ncbi:hypothetical protein NDU88_002733 [Pleurodeles waltl]|uniref:Uncharacterized protein n=1 Tax=Pleurodeles waltl TaxID=8319 RepID=A0AAV7REN1_PLEWA|nr:hypothetical protein NDU88_002733 [Pleurodeles waltl]